MKTQTRLAVLRPIFTLVTVTVIWMPFCAVWMQMLIKRVEHFS